jgi:hypothetical protein
MFVFPVDHSLSLKTVSVSRTILKNQLQAPWMMHIKWLKAPLGRLNNLSGGVGRFDAD